MSKRFIILFIAAIALLIAAVAVLVFEKNKEILDLTNMYDELEKPKRTVTRKEASGTAAGTEKAAEQGPVNEKA